MSTTKPEVEPYDLQAEPHEIHNLAVDPAYAADLQRLRDALNRWQEKYPDLGLNARNRAFTELAAKWRI